MNHNPLTHRADSIRILAKLEKLKEKYPERKILHELIDDVCKGLPTEPFKNKIK